MDSNAPLNALLNRPSIEEDVSLLDHLNDQVMEHSRSFIDFSKSTSWRSLLGRLIHFLIPSFLQGWRTPEQSRPAKKGPTAYLDGVRGLAAFTVFLCHHSFQAFSVDEGWGCNGGFYRIMRLPILRLLYAGRPSVSVFFVVSGYALSYRAVKLMRSRNTEELYTSMSSMIFRRAIRLYLPTFTSTGLVVVFLRLGFYESTRVFSADHANLRNALLPYRPRFESAWAQWMDWAEVCFHSIVPFSWNPQDGLNKYDSYLWTIPIEYRGSIYLFLIILGTAHLRTTYRLLTLMMIIWITYLKARWDFLLFLYGMAIAEWDHIRGAHTTHHDVSQGEKKELGDSRRTFIRQSIWNLISIIGLFLLSQPPTRSEVTPGWVTLTAMIPDGWDSPGTERARYWQQFGAGIFVLAVGHSKFWLRVYNSAIIQYLGNISYALYLVHGILLRWAAHRILRFFLFYVMGSVGDNHYKVGDNYYKVGDNYYKAGDNYYRGFWLATCFIIPMTIWVADIFWRAIDIPSVKFAKWFEVKLRATAWV
ncbi:acyltransferase 3 [Dactylonectria macrodidyma]|uniref:Acyltransferase 3 n=1 Tax=Dactylonectria macrodidyma TaxID=307937 RepID=A0A9P9EPA4_9HYPO|nr:acyltransferase 3 [Dactylonectria macrodidyma]